MKKFILFIALALSISASGQSDPDDFTQILPQYKGSPTMLYGDGVHDDTEALNNWGKGKRVYYKGKPVGRILQRGKFLVTWKVRFFRKNSTVRYNEFVWKYTGYEALDWFVYGRGVKHYKNLITDVGMGDSPYLSKPKR